jgi:hypothetical protein
MSRPASARRDIFKRPSEEADIQGFDAVIAWTLLPSQASCIYLTAGHGAPLILLHGYAETSCGNHFCLRTRMRCGSCVLSMWTRRRGSRFSPTTSRFRHLLSRRSTSAAGRSNCSSSGSSSTSGSSLPDSTDFERDAFEKTPLLPALQAADFENDLGDSGNRLIMGDFWRH